MAKTTKTAEVSAVADSGVKLGAVKSGSKGHGLTKLAGILLLALVVLAGLTIFIIKFVDKQNNTPSNNTNNKTATQSLVAKHSVSSSDASDYASNLAANGKYDDAQSYLDQQLAKTSDPATKADLLSTKSLLANSYDHLDDSLSFAKQAEATLPSTTTARTLYLIYSQQGDTVDAKVYLQKAIDRLNKNSSGYASTLKRYQQELQALGS